MNCCLHNISQSSQLAPLASAGQAHLAAAGLHPTTDLHDHLTWHNGLPGREMGQCARRTKAFWLEM